MDDKGLKDEVFSNDISYMISCNIFSILVCNCKYWGIPFQLQIIPREKTLSLLAPVIPLSHLVTQSNQKHCTNFLVFVSFNCSVYEGSN